MHDMYVIYILYVSLYDIYGGIMHDMYAIYILYVSLAAGHAPRVGNKLTYLCVSCKLIYVDAVLS